MLSQRGKILSRFALPHADNPPAQLSKLVLIFSVTFDVATKLFIPEVSFCLWHIRELAPFMSVPEAAMDKDNGLVFRKHNVWLSRQVLPVKAEPVTHPVQE